MDEETRLMEAARQLSVPLIARDAQRLLKLLDELAHWNRAYNLTAIHEREEMITHHLLDSLAIHPFLHGATVADVGTGAGFPGLPLAVVNPDREFTLMDSNSKKTRFVSHAARVLGLSNVTALHTRVESMRSNKSFDTVTARAFAPLPELLDKVAPLCDRDTQVLAMKAKAIDTEIARLPANWRVLQLHRLQVPGLEEERSVVVCGLRP